VRVKTMISQQAIKVQITKTVREAGRRMRNNGVSALPVIKGNELVGIISDP
jgi:CBS domain-containing protein